MESSIMSTNWESPSYGLEQVLKALFETLLQKNKLERRPDLNGKAICETQLRDQANPKKSHLIAAKRTFWFLSLGLQYLSVAKKASLVDKVAMFSAETDDIAAAGCCANILWT
ncbi:hypothetical protein Tco_0488156 [Tanacetum coccineum]